MASAETAAERRERLVGVARDLIARDGVGQCTFRRLAAAAGTSTRPFTHAFGTRDNLLRAVALSTWDGSPIDVHGDDPPGDDPPGHPDAVDQLIALGAYWLPLSSQQTLAERVYFEITLFALTRPKLHAELLGYSSVANARVAALIADGQARGQVRADLPAHELALAFWAVQAGLSFIALYEPEALPTAMAERLWRDGVERALRP